MLFQLTCLQMHTHCHQAKLVLLVCVDNSNVRLGKCAPVDDGAIEPSLASCHIKCCSIVYD